MSFNEYINTLKQKLNRANGILAKLRYYVSADTLKTIYYALFDSHMRYACQIWGQIHSKTVDMIQSAQNKALRIINFKQSMEPSEPLYQKLKINIPKTNTQMFGSNSIKIKSIKDWNEIIRKIHLSSELLFKRAEFMKLVKGTFHDDDPKIRLLYNILSMKLPSSNTTTSL